MSSCLLTSEFDEINAQIETQALEHGLSESKVDLWTELTAAVAQLRGALEENEGYFDTLQQAHDNLAEKLATLEAEHVDFTRDRARIAEENEEARNEVHQLRSELLRRATERSQVESVIVDLQRELHLAEDKVARQRIEHQHVVDAKVRELEGTHSELVEIRRSLAERDERVAELEDLLRAGLEREGEIARLTAMLKTRDERISELEHRQTERQRSLDERNEVVAGKDVAIAEWKHRVDEGEAEMAKLQKDLKAALQSASTKDMIIGVLRDRQRTAAYQRDEIVAAGLGERQEYEKKQQAMRQELEELRGETGRLQEHLEQSDQVMADLEELKTAGEDERRLVSRSRVQSLISSCCNAWKKLARRRRSSMRFVITLTQPWNSSRRLSRTSTLRTVTSTSCLRRMKPMSSCSSSKKRSCSSSGPRWTKRKTRQKISATASCGVRNRPKSSAKNYASGSMMCARRCKRETRLSRRPCSRRRWSEPRPAICDHDFPRTHPRLIDSAWPMLN